MTTDTKPKPTRGTMAHLTFKDTAATVARLHSAHAGGAGSDHRTALLAHLERIGCIDESDMVDLLEARGASTVVLVADAETAAERYPDECDGLAVTADVCDECLRANYDTVGGTCPNIR